MKSVADCYEELREYCETIPIVDCHDHTSECGPKYEDPMQVVVSGYFPSDVQSAAGEDVIAVLHDFKRPLEERWPRLEEAWSRTCHTGYAQVTKRVLKKFYGEEDVTLEALHRMKNKLLDLTDEKAFDAILGEANIVARIGDVWPDVNKVMDGSFKTSPRMKLAISLPGYHGVLNYDGVQAHVAPLNRKVTSLDEYISACREVFEGWKAFGAVAFKDQSAYGRTIAYENPTRAEAETVFNWFMEDPRRTASHPDGHQPLSDFLFHEFMRMARDLELPVQVHTGHMAGIRNDIAKTNAIGLTKVLELHRDVRFDLFHANWPYDDELVYLGKNYPNVALDFCWANIIDPVYCQATFKRILASVPHGKIHGFGADFGGSADRAWAHAQVARDNIAIALADMVEMEYMDLDEAKQVARAWLFENPNRFFALGLT